MGLSGQTFARTVYRSLRGRTTWLGPVRLALLGSWPILNFAMPHPSPCGRVEICEALALNSAELNEQISGRGEARAWPSPINFSLRSKFIDPPRQGRIGAIR